MRKNLFTWLALICLYGSLMLILVTVILRKITWLTFGLGPCMIIIGSYDLYSCIYNKYCPDDPLYELPLSIIWKRRRLIRSACGLIFGIVATVGIIYVMINHPSIFNN